MPDDDCEQYSVRRSRCHDVYGNRGEECLHEELTEKRCISMQRCPRQAIEYYGQQQQQQNDDNNNNNNIDDNNSNNTIDYENKNYNHNYDKALCASWAESFAYVNKELEHGEHVAIHHKEAHDIVSNDTKLRKECRQIAMDLALCLRETKQNQKRKQWW